MGKIKTKKWKMEAIKTHINFRCKVLNQQNEKHLFQFSHNYRALTVEQLQSNLCQLLLPDYHEVERDPDLLLYRRVKHQFNVNGTDVWYNGTVLSYDTDTKHFRIMKMMYSPFLYWTI